MSQGPCALLRCRTSPHPPGRAARSAHWRGSRWSRWSCDCGACATGVRRGRGGDVPGLQPPLGADAGFYAAPESRAPLLHLLLRALVDHGLLPSLGEGSLRLPFVFFGLLTVPVLGLVLRRWCGPGVALAAAVLLAFHPLHVQASQTAATPVMVPLLGLLAAAAFHGERPRWFAGGAALLAGLADPLGYAAAWTAWRRPGRGAVVRALPWLALGLLLLGGALPAWRWPLLVLAGVRPARRCRGRSSWCCWRGGVGPVRPRRSGARGVARRPHRGGARGLWNWRAASARDLAGGPDGDRPSHGVVGAGIGRGRVGSNT